MHVVHCAYYGGPYRGSFVPMLEAVASESARRGHTMTCVFPDWVRGRPWVPDLSVVTPVRFVSDEGSRAAATGRIMRALSSAVRTGGAGPAVIHTHFAAFDVPAALMRLTHRDLRVFWHEHGPLYDTARARLRNRARYRALGGLPTGVLAVSPEIRESLLARGAPRTKVHDFPNAIDVRRFAPATEEERAAARRELGLSPSAQVALHYGWDWQIKGGDLLLAASELLETEREVVVVSVTAQAVAHDRHNVTILPPQGDVGRLYAAADVFVSCGRSEGMPLAVLEALSSGLPVVATDLPVQRRLLEGLPAAATVPADPSAIAAEISRLLSLEPEVREQHRALARERITDGYGLDTWARRLVDLYETVEGR